ncbi:TetR family transcriptional regulator [Actinocorallia herbida]|uniref:TetR family transcriptional regulator n=1 Tax=Actinocorallia herbida TaxID=58109 RepID=A0A3N1CVH8_9ACTN|nr:TetR/AcrR family transcriptional regulator [Actinocorallia herbida]ROO85245.1 TetR family transcriptional regulator [Actinocorallia herbida]
MTESSPRARMRAPERRALITAAALESFAVKGYEGTSLGDIAKAAGVSRTVMYDHFPSKRVLLLAVLHEENAKLVEFVASRITASGSARERMRGTVDAYFSFAESRPKSRRVLFDLVIEDDPEISTVRQGIRDARLRAVAAMLASDMREIGVDPAEPAVEAMVEFIISGLDGVSRWWERKPQTPRQSLVEGVMWLLWTGLEPRS